MKINHTISEKTEFFLIHKLGWWILLVSVLFTASIRLGLLEIPLERDEGEYAYAGQLILQGVAPYQEVYNMKLPGIYMAYASIMAMFGQTPEGIHLGLLFINSLTIIFLFLLIRYLTDSFTASVSSAFFAVLTLGYSVHGIIAHAEHFVILAAVTGLFLLVNALDKNRSSFLFLSGVCLGIGFLMKQHGASFLALGGIYVLIFNSNKIPLKVINMINSLVIFVSGVILPYGITCIIFLELGIFDKFWFWTVVYAKAYISQVSLNDAWLLFSRHGLKVISVSPFIWILSIWGFIALLTDKQFKNHYKFVILFIIFSFFAVCPGFSFRAHYFIYILPAAALLASLAIRSMINFLSKFYPLSFAPALFLVITCVILSLWQQRDVLFNMNPIQISRFMYAVNPFPESLEIANFIRTMSKENDKIAIMGSEPQIYFYAQRHSATGYIYMYPLMENHKFALQMQKEMIKEIEAAKPEFLVLVNIYYSWLGSAKSHPFLSEWLESYQHQYFMVGLISINLNKTSYSWFPDIKRPPDSPHWVAVLKRKKE